LVAVNLAVKKSAVQRLSVRLLTSLDDDDDQ